MSVRIISTPDDSAEGMREQHPIKHIGSVLMALFGDSYNLIAGNEGAGPAQIVRGLD